MEEPHDSSEFVKLVELHPIVNFEISSLRFSTIVKNVAAQQMPRFLFLIRIIPPRVTTTMVEEENSVHLSRGGTRERGRRRDNKRDKPYFLRIGMLVRTKQIWRKGKRFHRHFVSSDSSQ